MHIENQWRTLEHDQARFFVGQLVAASETVFGPTAQEAGITTLSALRAPAQVGDESYPSITWSDPFAQDGTCVLVSNRYRSEVAPFVFARVTPEEGVHRVEGVALNIGPDQSVSLYGNMTVPRPENSHRADQIAGVRFLLQAKKLATPDNPEWRHLPGNGGASGFGMDSAKTGRLTRSILSLYSNVVVGGVAMERGHVADKTYTLARGLLAVSVDAHAAGKPVADSRPIYGAQSQLLGAMFEAPKGEFVAVREVPGAARALVALTVANGPFVEQSFIEAKGVFRTWATLPEGTNARAELMGLIPSLDSALGEDMSMRSYLEGGELTALDEKIVDLTQFRVHNRVA